MTYKEYVISLSPLRYWAMDEASGDVVDSMASQTMSATGTPDYQQTSGVPTPLQFAINFDPLSLERFRSTTPAAMGTGDLAIMLWNKPDSGTSTLRFIHENGHQFTSPLSGVALARNYSTDKYLCYISAVGLVITQSDTSAEDAWHCVTLNRSGGTLTMYVDNASKGTSAEAIVTAATNVEVGNWNGNITTGNSFDGQACHYAIWSRALTAGEIGNLYQYGLTGVPSGGGRTLRGVG